MVRTATGLLRRLVRLIGRRIRSSDRPTIRISPFLGQIMVLYRSLTGPGDLRSVAVNRRRARGTRTKIIEHLRALARKLVKFIGCPSGFSDGHSIHSSLRHIMGLTRHITVLAER
jgi:hypothetical protein